MKIEIDVSEENEGTDSPWWMIIDPKQMMKPKTSSVAAMIDGPFFSREEAQQYLKAKQYHYSDKVIIWCHSGYNTNQYKRKWREADAKSEK